MLINNLFSIAAAILMGTSELAKTFEVIILSRVVMGIFAGKWMVKGEDKYFLGCVKVFCSPSRAFHR